MLSWIHRRIIQAIWDFASWFVAVPLAVLVRFDFEPAAVDFNQSLLGGFFAGIAFLGLGLALGLYQGRYVLGSFDEVLGLLSASAVVSAAGLILTSVQGAWLIPRSTFIIATFIAVASILFARLVVRRQRLRSARRRQGSRILIYGAGESGTQMASLMMRDQSQTFQPVGFLDDDPRKSRLRRDGLAVLGTSDDLERVISKHGVNVLLVAIARIDARDLLALENRCRPLGVRVRVIPTPSEIARGALKLGEISDLTEEDIMGRRPCHTDRQSIAGLINGRRVLVTGAGGSIGSELVRQISLYSPARLVQLDRDESGLLATQLSLDGSGTLDSDALALADIRDSESLHDILLRERPEVVFHAAALKHLPLLESFPEEAWKTNVLGTRNLLQAALACGTDVFVNVSTDKAADPISALGNSKLITERMTAGVAAYTHSGKKRTYLSVRFGNVLGSRGSVIDTFRHQISAGGPVTVTDANATRYFMTVSEAVELVLQASVIGQHGETLILDMGSPVKVIDIANLMISRSGRDIDVAITGLRPGEKLSEQTQGAEETCVWTSHPLIKQVSVDPIDMELSASSLSTPAAERLRLAAHQAQVLPRVQTGTTRS